MLVVLVRLEQSPAFAGPEPLTGLLFVQLDVLSVLPYGFHLRHLGLLYSM